MTAHLRLLGTDRGAASFQLVLIVPVLLMFALLVVQFALLWHARHIAEYSARRALSAVRVEGGTAAEGRAQAQRSLAALGSDVMTSSFVSTERTATRTTVRVEGTVVRVLPVPGLALHVAGTASGSTERTTDPGGGRP
ncbi:TadE family protein [Streptomyces sp. TS71-3]|uniref:TadE family protein n=1 Tax=Streptomyces sp. TS71-3 TaxID=2733862 RepID=UPI001B0F94CE|nr:TadE family protein [Streptomyces sp. TS71-3]GHJ35441.1 hypothetical protein Sm713_10500 [Streptomyces sp. TS71-3]